MALNATSEVQDRQDASAAVPESAVPPDSQPIAQIVGGAKRILERQGEIWLTQAKIKLLQLGIFVGLIIAATAFLVLSFIFLLIGVFHILTDVFHIPSVWASLLFAAICALGAFGLLIPVIFQRQSKPSASRLSAEAPA